MKHEPAPDRRRRSLTHVGGDTETAGDADAARALAHALEVAPSSDDEDDPSRDHVHGFHSYPARMHPVTAGRLVQSFCRPGGRVFDPFCGSGTVLVEALLFGRRAVGGDLNPLAALLARRKTTPRTEAEVEHLVQEAVSCGEFADSRRKAKAGASRRFPTEDMELFEPHVLLELDSLRLAVFNRTHDPAYPDLQLVLSSILVKLSKKRGDTSAAGVMATKRTAAGFPARFFARKAEEFARRLGAFTRRLPPGVAEAVVARADATSATPSPGPVDAVVTSPPYAATYDYSAQHALRLRWLGLEAEGFVKGEIGSRAAYKRISADEARAAWCRELGRFLTTVWPLLPPDGPLAMVVADSAVWGTPLRADEIVAEVSRKHGFTPVARASQPRPHFHGPTMKAFQDRPRHEHAILLRKAVAVPHEPAPKVTPPPAPSAGWSRANPDRVPRRPPPMFRPFKPRGKPQGE
jgi:hypothetical protein